MRRNIGRGRTELPDKQGLKRAKGKFETEISKLSKKCSRSSRLVRLVEIIEHLSDGKAPVDDISKTMTYFVKLIGCSRDTASSYLRAIYYASRLEDEYEDKNYKSELNPDSDFISRW
jgi:hypothetical protein